tara:strand:- start:556 stop:1011 length:456 start_codon:yes stop_codon:yes gene_type:complete
MELKSLQDTKNFSKKICKIIKPGDIIFLCGELGVGKTALARFIINYLEEKNKVKISDILSPTFNIVYDYVIKDIRILHYDLYRLKNYKDISELGIFETSNDYIKIIEWPELIKPKPENRIEIILKYSDSMEYRYAEIIGHGKWKDYKFDEY